MVVSRERGAEEMVCVINVYAPCDDEEQLLLWDRLRIVVEQWKNSKVCVIGDFNAILEVGERVGEGEWAF